MPKAFDTCRKNGGKIRTVNLKGGKYVHVCSLGGKSYRGYEKMKKSSSEGSGHVAAAIKKRMK